MEKQLADVRNYKSEPKSGHTGSHQALIGTIQRGTFQIGLFKTSCSNP